MSKRRNQHEHHPDRQHEDHRPHDEAPSSEREPWVVDQSRQQSMATHARETRTKMSTGQANTMRLKKGNAPRHG